MPVCSQLFGYSTNGLVSLNALLADVPACLPHLILSKKLWDSTVDPGSFSECQARRKLGCLVPCSGLLVAVPVLCWRWFSRVPRRLVRSLVNLLPQASLRTSWAQASEPQCHCSTKHSLCARIDGSTELFRSPCNKISLLLTNPLPVGNVQSHHFRPHLSSKSFYFQEQAFHAWSTQYVNTSYIRKSLSQCNRPPQLPNSRKGHQDLGLFAPRISSSLEADRSTCTPVIGSPGKVAALMESQKVTPHLSALAERVQRPYQPDKAYVILKVILPTLWKNRTSASGGFFLLPTLWNSEKQ